MSKALERIIAIDNDAREFGFDWPHQTMVIEWIISEAKEVLSAINENEPKHRIQEEIGDVLHAAISLCLYSGFDVEDTLDKTTEKFTKRMQHLKEIAKNQGLNNLHGQSLSHTLELWAQAKLATQKG